MVKVTSKFKWIILLISVILQITCVVLVVFYTDTGRGLRFFSHFDFVDPEEIIYRYSHWNYEYILPMIVAILFVDAILLFEYVSIRLLTVLS